MTAEDTSRKLHPNQLINVLLHCSTSQPVLKVALSSPAGYQMFLRLAQGGGSWSHAETQNVSQFSKNNFFACLGLYMVLEQ